MAGKCIFNLPIV